MPAPRSRSFQSALELEPGHDPALYNLARAKIAIGELAAAEADLRLLQARLLLDTPAVRIRDTTTDLARVLMDQGRPEEALEVLQTAAVVHPAIILIRAHEAFAHLLLGRFAEGWRAYEIRWETVDHRPPPPDYRVLDLNEVAGQRVLIKEEQGRGDIIQFLRYVRPLAALGARIRLCVYQDLMPLALEMPEVELVIDADDDEPGVRHSDIAAQSSIGI